MDQKKYVRDYPLITTEKIDYFIRDGCTPKQNKSNGARFKDENDMECIAAKR